ncbi:unnamed protein product [Mesocestoides corti]|uniref:Uncharacterized protein n=2 Tax=Mesocestoides corti TaxID=53468 RepID=A0A0R3U5H0_MESCO|nr:unnamed protein product [Mesocestoides corti]
MATECAQVVTLADKQKSAGKSAPPPKHVCQPFTLRLILGVPILKEDNKVVSNLECLFAKYAKNEKSSSNQPPLKAERDIFWEHIVIGVNSIVKQMETVVRDASSSKSADPFSVILLDFAWLNSQLGHHLAHLCSGTPHTSLVAVSPPGKLAKIVTSPLQNLNTSTPKIACVGIRPLMTPHSTRLPVLRECLRMCASLTGKPLPPDPAASTAASLSADAAASGATVGSTPQYVPILPKPPTSILVPPVSLDIAPSPAAVGGGYVVAAGGTPSLITSTLISQPGPSQTPMQKPQMPPKPPIPRPAVRHIPADDWLTYKLDHAKLYKCGADISKELENHSLYIHDVADIWALYPRQLQKPDIVVRRPAPTPKSHKSRGPPNPPPSKQRRSVGHHAAHPPPPPPNQGYFDDEELGDEEEEEDYDYPGGGSSYLESPRHHRYSRHHQSPSPMSREAARGMYRKHHPELAGQYSGLGKRRARGDSGVGRRTSPRW